MAMMKAMINKQAPSENGAPAERAVQSSSPAVPENVLQQLYDLQSQVFHFSMHTAAGPKQCEAAGGRVV